MMSSVLDSDGGRRIYVMLPINTSIRTFPQNISSNFTIQRMKTLAIERWVGLAGIQYPQHCNNISEDIAFDTWLLFKIWQYALQRPPSILLHVEGIYEQSHWPPQQNFSCWFCSHMHRFRKWKLKRHENPYAFCTLGHLTHIFRAHPWVATKKFPFVVNITSPPLYGSCRAPTGGDFLLCYCAVFDLPVTMISIYYHYSDTR